jgi:hypothetical protein
LKPFVDFGFGFEPFDGANFDAGTVGLDLPVVLRDALQFEDDPNPGSFAHDPEYDFFGAAGKPLRLLYSN